MEADPLQPSVEHRGVTGMHVYPVSNAARCVWQWVALMTAKQAWLTAAAVLFIAPFKAFVMAVAGEAPGQPLGIAAVVGLFFGAMCLVISSDFD